MDHLSQHLALLTVGWNQAAPSAPGVGLDSQTRIACPPFLGCSDNELIHSFFQSHEKRDLLYQGLDALPLSASKEPGPDNQKNNSQLASSWQTGRAADTQGSTD